MTKGKVVIVVLVVIGLLFAFGLGTNLLPKDEEPEGGKKADTEQQKKSVNRYNRNSWIGSMDKLLGRFSPRLDVSRLPPPPDCGDDVCWFEPPRPGFPGVVKCNRNDNVLTFTSNTGCAIKIRSRLPGCDNDYESTTLKLAKGAAATRAAAARIKMSPALMQAQPLSRHKLKMAVIPPKLAVMYQPKGKSSESIEEKDDEFRLVVLEQGGTLKLSCKGCSKNQPVEVILATRESCD